MPPNLTILFFHDSNHREVSAILTEPESSTDRIVILFHGFLSNKHSSTNRRLTELLIDQENSTFCFDWFGMGESDGAFTDLTVDICCGELEQAVAFVQKRNRKGKRAILLFTTGHQSFAPQMLCQQSILASMA